MNKERIGKSVVYIDNSYSCIDLTTQQLYTTSSGIYRLGKRKEGGSVEARS